MAKHNLHPGPHASSQDLGGAALPAGKFQIPMAAAQGQQGAGRHLTIGGGQMRDLLSLDPERAERP